MSGELQPEGGWLQSPAPRLVAPKPADRGLLFRGISRASVLFGRAQVPDIFSVFHINSRLFWAWLFFASRLMPRGKLPAGEREKIILRTGWNSRSRYEWGQHVDIALRVGVTDDEIVCVSRGPVAFPVGRDQLLMQACDELCCERKVSDKTWQALSREYSDKLMIEIVILIGHYVMVAGFLNSAGLVLEAATEKTLQNFYRRINTAKTADA